MCLSSTLTTVPSVLIWLLCRPRTVVAGVFFLGPVAAPARLSARPGPSPARDRAELGDDPLPDLEGERLSLLDRDGGRPLGKDLGARVDRGAPCGVVVGGHHAFP